MPESEKKLQKTDKKNGLQKKLTQPEITENAEKRRKRKISFLVAFDENGTIGCKGKIPWNLKTERSRFKKICGGKKIIMGRKTFEEIGGALPYCTIVIISKTMKIAPQGCLLAHSVENAFSYYNEDEEILVAGGGEIYRQLIEETDTIYATLIEKKFAGDVFFPKIDAAQWNKSEKKYFEENGVKFCYFTLTRSR